MSIQPCSLFLPCLLSLLISSIQSNRRRSTACISARRWVTHTHYIGTYLYIQTHIHICSLKVFVTVIVIIIIIVTTTAGASVVFVVRILLLDRRSPPQDIIPHNLIQKVPRRHDLSEAHLLRGRELPAAGPHGVLDEGLPDLVQRRDADGRAGDVVEQRGRRDPHVAPVLAPAAALVRRQPRDEAVQQPPPLREAVAPHQLRHLPDPAQHKHERDVLGARRLRGPPAALLLQQRLLVARGRGPAVRRRRQHRRRRRGGGGGGRWRGPQLARQHLQDEAVHVEELQAQRGVEAEQDGAVGGGDGARGADVVADVAARADAAQVALEDGAAVLFQKIAHAEDERDHLLVHAGPHLALALARVLQRVREHEARELARQPHRRDVPPPHREQVRQVGGVGQRRRVQACVEGAHFVPHPVPDQRGTAGGYEVVEGAAGEAEREEVCDAEGGEDLDVQFAGEADEGGEEGTGLGAFMLAVYTGT